MTFELTADDLMCPTLNVLRELGGSGTIEEIHSALVESLNLSEDQISYQQEGSVQTDFYNRTSLARTFLKKIDFITNPGRGVWVVTPRGQSATDEDVKKEIRQYRHEFYERQKGNLDKSLPPFSDDKSAEDQAVEVGLESEILWTEILLRRIQSLSPSAFERLCQRLLRESGFQFVKVTGRAGDGGIDGVGILRLNLVSFQVVFQCKRYKEVVGAPSIRDFRGAMDGRGEKGLFITTGRFTEDAQSEARRDGAAAIDLIDGMELCSLLKDLHLGVDIKQVEEVTVNPHFFDEFEVKIAENT